MENKNCGVMHEVPVTTTELQIATENVEKRKNSPIPSVKVALGILALNKNFFHISNKINIKICLI